MPIFRALELAGEGEGLTIGKDRGRQLDEGLLHASASPTAERSSRNPRQPIP